MKLLITFLLLLTAQYNSFGQENNSIAIIPAPQSIEKKEGKFIFSKNTIILGNSLNKSVEFFTSYLFKNWGLRNKIVSNELKTTKELTVLEITERGAESLPKEGYQLIIAPSKIKLIGQGAGLFYGIQSLIQLFPIQGQGPIELPCLKIIDQPRFAYRGLMLDVSRHFFTVQDLKDLLDLMASYKLNRFHWHLTDDQGWRIEIKSFPRLTAVGAWRVPRKDFGGNPPQDGEKPSQGGFYTQDQIKEVIQYAAQKNIQVMPEIDVPGHSMAAIAAYPELSVTKDPNAKVNPGSSFARWFPDGSYEMFFDNTLNPTDEKVYQFLDKVFTEVANLFPYEYIHIGGDECFKGFWDKDPGVKAFMKANNILTTQQLQAYFTKRVTQIIHSKNRKVIGWDEIDNGQLGDGVAIMNRFGEKGALSQTKRKVPIILAPGDNGLYFDYAQSRSEMEPVNHGGFSPLWKTYAYNAEYPTMSAEDKEYILGVEACIWTEGMSNMRKVNYMVLPRLLALAEGAWSPISAKNYNRFAAGPLSKHLEQFDRSGLNFRVPTAVGYTDTLLIGNRFEIPLTVPFKGAKIYYTLNNRFPDIVDHEYTEPIVVDLLPGKKVVLKTIVLTPSGKRSVLTRTTMFNPMLKKATNLHNLRNGLSLQLVNSNGSRSEIDYNGIADFKKEIFQSASGNGFILSGYVWIESDEVIEFSSNRNDVVLTIDEIRVIESGKSVSDPLFLQKGYHKIQIDYLKSGSATFGLFRNAIGEQKKELKWAEFFH